MCQLVQCTLLIDCPTACESDRIRSISSRSGLYSQNKIIHFRDCADQACHPLSVLDRQGYQVSHRIAGQSNRGHHKAPESNERTPKLSTVVMDCGKAGAAGGKIELIQLAVVDFWSGEVLIDDLVEPACPIKDWRSDCHGVTESVMSVVAAPGATSCGWQSARAQLWKRTDQNTIVIGQSISFDLDALHMLHMKLVDTAIIRACHVQHQSKSPDPSYET